MAIVLKNLRLMAAISSCNFYDTWEKPSYPIVLMWQNFLPLLQSVSGMNGSFAAICPQGLAFFRGFCGPLRQWRSIPWCVSHPFASSSEPPNDVVVQRPILVPWLECVLHSQDKRLVNIFGQLNYLFFSSITYLPIWR